jgi:hypothetical protein
LAEGGLAEGGIRVALSFERRIERRGRVVEFPLFAGPFLLSVLAVRVVSIFTVLLVGRDPLEGRVEPVLDLVVGPAKPRELSALLSTRADHCGAYLPGSLIAMRDQRLPSFC